MKMVKGEATGKVVLDHEITAMEDKISVPAGEYTAARVETNLTMNASFRGTKIPTETLKMTSWYAPGAGLVKRDVKGKMGTVLMEYIGK
jgi:hypothetical protein